MTTRRWTLIVLSLAALASYTYALRADALPPGHAGAAILTDDPATPTSSALLRQEAEDGSIQQPMMVGSDPDASNGQFVYTTVSYDGYDELHFYVTTGADYEIWGRASADSYGSDTFWVTVDGGPEATWDIPIGPWTWAPVTHRESTEPPVVQVYYLREGVHRVRVLGREAGARLDVLELRPAGIWPTATPVQTHTPTLTPTYTATAAGTPADTATSTPSPTSTPTGTPPGDLILAGRVFDATVGARGGIPGATVSVIMCMPRRFETTTDANGDYSQLVPGLYLNQCVSVTLAASAAGYEDLAFPVEVSLLRLNPVRDFPLLPLPPSTRTATASPTLTATQSPTDTPTRVPTDTQRPTLTVTPSATATQSPTDTPTQVPTATDTQLPTRTPTTLPTATQAPSPTLTPTPTKYRVYLPIAFRPRLPTPGPTPTLTPTAAPGWIVLVNEGFEGSFPAAGWTRSSSGAYDWLPRNCRAHSGDKSAWSVGQGGSAGQLPCGGYYPTDVTTKLVYGPFSLQDAAAAKLTFWSWSLAEYDTCFFGASTDGVGFGGRQLSLQTEGWENLELDLSAVPYFGNLLGSAKVWIIFRFASDYSPTLAHGWYVDDVRITKLVGDLGAGVPVVHGNAADAGKPAFMQLPGP